MPASRGLVVFSHGKDSNPGATKISALRPVAEQAGWQTHAIDYSDTNDPVIRKDRLVAFIRTSAEPIVLWGSSLGGVVSVFAAREVVVSGLFLLAPAVHWPGYEHLDHQVEVAQIEVVHGWRDDVVPFALSQRFAAEHHARLHLLDDDHLLHDTLDDTSALFARFLNRIGDA